MSLESLPSRVNQMQVRLDQQELGLLALITQYSEFARAFAQSIPSNPQRLG